ncbi:4-hydroxy-tetrahydrodipicolinate synthase [Enterococcus larvae]|uniref:4-hydroxy-tetrahydrodipicolinate synthase n=1 Tax=Enterococcus larvae TaxID=2794352 RepID=UPI003F2B79E2
MNGIITAMVTPFNDKGEINKQATKDLIRYLLEKKIDGLFILGTNGEFHVLEEKEKLSFAQLVIDEVSGQVPVYVGSGGNSTKQVVTLSKQMTELGADALSVISPYFVPPTEHELVAHYTTIADAVTIPVLMYNIPKNTGVNISKEAVTVLARHENIAGIKDSSGKLENMVSYIHAAEGQSFNVLSGSDSLILSGLKAGATGAVAATSNALPEIDRAIYQLWLEGNLKEAEAMQQSIEPFRAILKLGTIPSVLKAAVGWRGIDVGSARLPVQPLSPASLQQVEAVMKEHYAR